MDSSVFKTYDVRGIYPDQINEELAYHVGRAFVQFLGCKNVVVGFDMRDSSKSLQKELVRGITDQGANVIDIGLVPTPLVSFSVSHYNHDAGIVVSASHNPGNYNAFKLIKNPVIQIGKGSGIEEIRDLAIKNEFQDSETKGSVSQKNAMDDYVNHVLEYAKEIKDLKVVCDYGNGMGSIFSKPLFEKMNVEAIHMYPEPDGNFPNHPANPHEIKNMQDLQKKVVEEKADLGVFFDGDADRSVIIDEKGDIVFADIFIALTAPSELEKYPGEKVYFDLRFSKIVEEVIKKNGGIPEVMRVGNPFYKEALCTKGGVLAGEFSGHAMFKDNYNIDDGLFAAVKVMALVSKSGKKLSELVEPLKVYANTPEINMKISSVEKGDEIIKALETEFNDEKLLHLDGVSVEGDGWWFNLRKSNTEPLVRLRAEANTSEKLEEVKEKVMKIIDSINR